MSIVKKLIVICSVFEVAFIVTGFACGLAIIASIDLHVNTGRAAIAMAICFVAVIILSRIGDVLVQKWSDEELKVFDDLY